MTLRTILSDSDLESPLVGKAVTAHIKSHGPEGFDCTVYDAGTGWACDALLPRIVAHELSGEAVPPELATGDTVIALVVGVSGGTEDGDGRLMLSVTSHELVGRLLTGFVEEILSGKAVIKGIARVAGTKSKIAVAPTVPGLDAREACIGHGATRVKGVERLLNRAFGSEKLEIIEYSGDRATFLANAMKPVEVADVLVEGEHAVVAVEPHQLSGDIGERGLNARLAGRLTDLSIHVVTPGTDLRQAMDRLAAEKTPAETA
jgi:transcription antitermination factor NusA-like protein